MIDNPDMTRPKTAVYFTTIAALSDGHVVMGGHLYDDANDPTVTLVVWFDGNKWGLVEKTEEIIYGIAACAGINEIGVLGRGGYFFRTHIPPTGERLEIPVQSRDFTYFEGLTCYEGQFVCCGGSYQVQVLKPEGWVDISGDIFRPFEKTPENFAFSVSVSKRGEIFVCGTDGFVAAYASDQWRVLDCPTNVMLNKILCASDGSVYLCGGGGLIYRVSMDDQWEDLSDPGLFDSTFWDMAEYRGRIYLATGGALYTVDEAGLAPVGIPCDNPPEISALASNTSLWGVGDDFLYEFNGEEWKLHIPPSNRPTRI